ncbi:DUF6602 domain-containing protein [Fodinibius salsisoli]|uniref:DUF6602 domain-containing protein n=1 Tax=Fodinibius salsisoli TaxID=2820877 RepID=A0ABT3PQX5_9BACT|nr:DUF6602 domain-containing protein [Fodinibius salsisoli]MCW9708264.1 hypothetical protein [Fodinibius salsisoli]
MGSKKGFNTQGWKQFLTQRKQIIDAYDQAKAKGGLKKVQTDHGNVLEAEFRKWLEKFLPKRFAVTSGYIISQGLGGKEKAPHYDVIIYDALNSPVLWIDENPDSSSSGKSKAIPVEYVFGILEIKSSFNPKSVRDALKHLKELKPLMEGIDDPNERYKTYLPPNFFCATVFCEIRNENKRSKTAFNAFNKHQDLRRFYGGLILRKETEKTHSSGKIIPKWTNEPLPNQSMDNPERNLFESIWSKSFKVKKDLYTTMMIDWSQKNFAEFAFDLIALMQGTYKQNQLSSWHGIGMSIHEE